jgi:hypothetical protein
LLSEQLGITLQSVGSGKRMTFGAGEAQLSEWMAENAFMTWVCCENPWVLEEHLITSVCVPLNLDQNSHNEFHAELKGIRRKAKALAKG